MEKGFNIGLSGVSKKNNLVGGILYIHSNVSQDNPLFLQMNVIASCLSCLILNNLLNKWSLY
jgi:hypothetical protein